jgi:hypothetical protein
VLDDQTAIVRLADHADDASLQERFGTVKRANKVALGRLIYGSDESWRSYPFYNGTYKGCPVSEWLRPGTW